MQPGGQGGWKSFADNKSHLFLLRAAKEELMTNIHQDVGQGRGLLLQRQETHDFQNTIL